MAASSAASLRRVAVFAYPALGAAGILAELGGDAKGVHELSLAGPELPEELGDGPGLDAAAEEGVQLLRAGVHLPPGRGGGVSRAQGGGGGFGC